MQTLSGRTCVFAGASGGHGVAAVKALCAGGMNVVMATHQPEKANRLAAEVNSLNLQGRCYVISGTSGPAEHPPNIESSVETYGELFGKFGSVDVIISNVGGDGPAIGIEDVTTETLLQNISRLVGHGFSMLRSALPYLKKSRAARVIFMTSVGGQERRHTRKFHERRGKGRIVSYAELRGTSGHIWHYG